MIHWPPDSWALWDNVLALGTSPRGHAKSNIIEASTSPWRPWDISPGNRRGTDVPAINQNWRIDANWMQVAWGNGNGTWP